MKPGDRLKSAVCDTQVVVIKGASATIPLECGGVPMGERDGAARGTHAPRAGFDGGTALGRRYTDEATGLVVLCTQGGAGALSMDGRLLGQMAAKLLPASD